MQIELVVGGLNGDLTAQAIQLRMRRGGQDKVAQARLVAWDANGKNPIVLTDFLSNVPTGSLGSRILIASAGLSAHTNPPADPDFTMVATIPASYFLAGSITYENDSGTLRAWRLSWGGSGYTGATTGAMTNDVDTDFGPPYAGSLVTAGVHALVFGGAADDPSTTNQADYALSVGPVTLVNNAGTSFTAVLNCDGAEDADGDFICSVRDNCPDAANVTQLDRDRDGVGDSCDGCADDSAKTEPGDCGCGEPETDTDGDGLADCIDPTPTGDTSGGGPPDGGTNGGAVPPGGGDPSNGGGQQQSGLCGAGVGMVFPLLWLTLFVSRRRAAVPVGGLRVRKTLL